MTVDVTVQKFDPLTVHQGDVIRFRRLGDTARRNGIITKVAPDRITVLFANIQNNATSYAELTAADVAGGVWEVYWSTDLLTVNYNPGADTGGGGA
jgi:hypothetical protein